MKDYQSYFQAQESEWEDMCIRCGGCCGSFDDPCKHLRKDPQQRYWCDIYHNRLGTREAVSGEKFQCVHIREILNTHWKNDHLCSYKRHAKKPWLRAKVY